MTDQKLLTILASKNRYGWFAYYQKKMAKNNQCHASYVIAIEALKKLSGNKTREKISKYGIKTRAEAQNESVSNRAENEGAQTKRIRKV